MSGIVSELDLSRAWPWAQSFCRILLEERSSPFSGSHLMFGSDYSGTHRGSRFNVYTFLVADADASPHWPARMRAVRRRFLSDGRRMSFKRLGDVHRQRALRPFLEATNFLTGHIVAVVINKDLQRLSTSSNALSVWRHLHGLCGKWNPGEFENLVRIVHLFTLLLATWSRPGMHISWITDEDRIVANDDRHTDALLLAARMAPLYVPHCLGEFAFSSTAADGAARAFEDFVAIPDLVAGMFAEAITYFSDHGTWKGGGPLELKSSALSQKSEMLSDWFWEPSDNLLRTAIIVDRHDEDRFWIGRFGPQQ